MIKSPDSPRTSSPRKYTYADYLTWHEDERWEVIDGEAYDMSAAPATKHQAICGELHRQLANFFLKKPCKVYFAPFEVRLAESTATDANIRNVVQPDLLVVCDRRKIDARGLKGSPDLAVEILSPSTASKDRVKKLNLYERFGVREFWIVSPDSATVMSFRLGVDGRYDKPLYFCWSDTLTTPLFPGLEIDLNLVFPTDEDDTSEAPDPSPAPPSSPDTPAPRVRETAKPYSAPAKPKSRKGKPITKRR